MTHLRSFGCTIIVEPQQFSRTIFFQTFDQLKALEGLMVAVYIDSDGLRIVLVGTEWADDSMFG